MEIWKDIDGFSGYYEISSSGRVRNIRTGRVLKPSVTDQGYTTVKLYRNNKAKEAKIHRLVASAFIQNPENKPQVNHLDRNKRNNDVSNLEWSTNRENIDHAIRTGLNKTRNSKLAMNKRYRSNFVQLTLLIPKEVNVKLQNMAEETGSTRTAISREAIINYLSASEEGET